MLKSPRLLLVATTCLSLLSILVSSHTVITYPGMRGDNLHTTGNITGFNGSDIAGTNGLGVGSDNTYPYGMQWIYPCGGMPMSTNRTKWPVTGGAIGVQPGWFQGHYNALFYINLGDGTVPENYSLIMQPVFGIVGPDNFAYNGSFCLPQVPLPANYSAVIGTNATIQIVEAAQHGAALFNCVDITFADPQDVAEVTPDNCANTSDITLQYVYSTNSQTSDAEILLSSKVTWMASIPFAVMVVWGLL
ncbi:MAG: hypothetical protein ALECFALPRED_009846 [Alectoria fallacina]|uniref:Copper acquisition factor BIM1-like domain-containing protein n=1 Tax=Alectoria fallacina TaxID=1903189 RepID=A0A8H3F0R2_9LECA|nr:MAG: hypothetical protein ALECFALPRED_009846 [Alectoria fallacina]